MIVFAGPEVARVIEEFEIACGDTTTTDETHHLEQTSGTQCTFSQQVVSLVAAFEECGKIHS